MKTLITTFILLACTALPVVPAVAATFNVSPIRVGLTPNKSTMPLTITNDSDEAVVIQVQAMRWSQEKGEDVYVRTDEILATPPIVTIPGHGAQIIRVGLRRPLAAASELSYRLFLAEIPGTVKPGFIGVQMNLRISLPVFVTGATTGKPDLQWTVISSGPRAAMLKVSNAGNAHAQIADLQLLDIASNQVIARQPTAAYLLPGTTREWALQLELGKSIGTQLIRLQGYMDSGDVTTDLLPQ